MCGEVAPPGGSAHGPRIETCRIYRQTNTASTRTHRTITRQKNIRITKHAHPNIVGCPRPNTRPSEEPGTLLKPIVTRTKFERTIGERCGRRGNRTDSSSRSAQYCM